MDELTHAMLPSWLVEEMPVPMGEGRNNQMIKMAPTMLACGMEPGEVMDYLKSFYDLEDDDEKDAEIERVITNALRYAEQRSGELGVKINKAAFAQERRRLDAITAQASRDLHKLILPELSDYHWPVSHVRACGHNLPTLFKLEDQRRMFLHTMFESDDVVWVGDVFQSGLTKREKVRVDQGEEVSPRNASHFKTIGEWLELSVVPGEFCSHCTFKPGSYQRLNENVVARRFLVVESDVLTKDQVGSVFAWLASCGLNLRAVVDTGGKSLHGWYDWPGDQDVNDWKAMLVGLRCDPSTLRHSQPVRLPGCVRKDTQRPQELLYLA